MKDDTKYNLRSVPDAELHRIRYLNLKQICMDKFDNNRLSMAKHCKRQGSHITSLILDNPLTRRAIGERLARSLEKEIGLKQGYLDTDWEVEKYTIDIDVYGDVDKQWQGDTMLNKVRLSKRWVDANIYAPKMNKLMIATKYGDDMSPTFNHGDPLVIDTTPITGFTDGIYMFKKDLDTYIRRVYRNPTTGELLVKADNPIYQAFMVDKLDDIEIVGKCCGGWNWRKA